MKKPTPQISPRHCTDCGQLLGSPHCDCRFLWSAANAIGANNIGGNTFEYYAKETRSVWRVSREQLVDLGRRIMDAGGWLTDSIYSEWCLTSKAIEVRS